MPSGFPQIKTPARQLTGVFYYRLIMMKIQILSDIHLEHHSFGQSSSPILGDASEYQLAVTDSDVIVLAGDIGVGDKGIMWAGRQAEVLGKEVIYVSGNHEFYGHEYSSALITMQMTAKDYGINFLDNSEVIISGVRFLGCTLWTDFLAYGDKSRSIVELARGLADFSEIRVYPKGIFGGPDETEVVTEYRRMHPEDQIKLFARSLSWLKEKLAEPFDGKTVVISHHGPSPACQHPVFPLGPISAGFWSDIEDVVGQADLWIYGHTHACLDTVVNGTRVVANQLGYPREKVDGFKPDKVVVI